MTEGQRPRYRRPRRPAGTGGPQNGSGPGANGGDKPRSGGFRRSRRRRGGSNRTLSGPQVVQKYLNLLDQHMVNRRKYFEYYDREDGRHRRRLEKNFFASIEQLRRFEEKLESWQKEHLKKHTDRYRLDHTYTSNHALPVEGEEIGFEGEFADPHFTEDQREAFLQYEKDTEESSGTLEDYQAYKASK